jgi:xylan 1,4-beta-xylosidase
MRVELDFSRKIGAIRPVHGVNNGPMTSDFMRDATKLFKRIGIPYSRLHDTEGSFGAGEYVDIPAVFKNFDADATDPKNYNFEMTDHYIRSILNAGTKVIYRLGVSIENGPFKKHIHPPKDYGQWAKICEGIIRHYTEGWADGFIDGVEYFEIWNEPEFLGHMWTGTFEEFYKLFKNTIIYLKEKFPKVKIGGPATGLTRDEFTKGFFEYLVDGERAPLDFFSFHTYFRSTKQIGERMHQVKDILQKSGYESVEILCTEWNHVNGWNNMQEEYVKISNHTGAAFVACALCEFQRAGYSAATYYDAQFNTSFNGLFKLPEFKGHDDIHELAPKPSYYAMEMFGDLYRMGTEVYSAHDKGISVVAATDGEQDAFLIGRYDTEGQDDLTVVLDIKNTKGKTAEIHRYVPDRNEIAVETVEIIPNTITLAPYSFATVILK